MNFESNLEAGRNLYIIPKGCKGVEEVITIKNSKNNTRVEVYFPYDYQVLTDEVLRNRRISLQEYIEQTKEWRE